MKYLIDTNVICELRKGQRCHPAVASWFKTLSDNELYLSVLNIGELRRGIESIRGRDNKGARALERWFARVVKDYADRILPVDSAVAEEWGRLNVPDPLPVVDSLLAATAKVHGLTIATRNTTDIARTGVPHVNPFEGAAED